MTDLPPYSAFIAISRYARWRDTENRRETWQETVDRYLDHMRKHLNTSYGYSPQDPIFQEVRDAILNLDVLPSMRGLMTAGPALERNSMTIYNCSFLAVDDLRVFDEAMFILMSGTGAGYSVERKYVEKLPVVPESLMETDEVIVVEDSKEGWARALRTLITELYNGRILSWDTSLVRPVGARLKTFGGRASGPQPLRELFAATVEMFRAAAGRRLTPLECHDLMCLVGDIVVAGGSRRSALISLSDLESSEMARAKSGAWWERYPFRALANNSVTYLNKPGPLEFLREWGNLVESQSGERGIFNLGGIRKHISQKSLGRDGSKVAGTNPCGEISLRDMGLCNLSSVTLKEGDSVKDVRNKVRLASILGTWQSTFTNFPYVRGEWKSNSEEERLLGVSLNGIYGHHLFNDPTDEKLPQRLESLRSTAHDANAAEATKLGINRSVSVTTVKPEGTSSQLCMVSSGIHPWHSQHYIRSVRGANHDPLTQLMKDSGVPNEPDVMKPDANTVFFFPIAAPKSGVTRDRVDAMSHLALYLMYRKHWADHQVSITVNVSPHEWVRVGAWVYDNWDDVAGISFLPKFEDDTSYTQLPYQTCTKEEYEEMVSRMPAEIRFQDLMFYETEDGTTGSQTLACTAGGCEVIDLVSDEGGDRGE